ncbi:MAG: glycoside hydrolase family 9 protein [Sphingobacteriales bacterium]|nr:glycoside hydrolase family 9 protein [Sphingobacteriales bacterium]
MKKAWFVLLLPLLSFSQEQDPQSWIRVNLLGYKPDGVKIAVWCGKGHGGPEKTGWELVNPETGIVVMKGRPGKDFGEYGPFTRTYRLDFSACKKPGLYFLRAGGVQSPEFSIGQDVYKGAADFCLRYMRQQRSGFNPFLKDSCHTHDGYVLYGEKAGIKDSTHIDVTGGWHDASDYLQYSSTSANATYHLLMAYRDFPQVFTDEKQANGMDGKNGRADVLDEAKWGLDWLLKMHPKDDWMFNQVGDDRDHQGMRIPKEDTNYYGKGLERPVYFINGEPQQRGKFLNATTGTGSTAGKFASAFALGTIIFDTLDTDYSRLLDEKSTSAKFYMLKKKGTTQTVSVKSPYIYAEENWVDDLELACAVYQQNIRYFTEKSIKQGGDLFSVFDDTSFLSNSYRYAKMEPLTPWLGSDTANHYQWYPFINIGHYELAKQVKDNRRDSLIDFYKQGIEKVWDKAKLNAFCRGIPYIWCSNNLTASFAIQCYWYKELTGDKQFGELEQANFDWLFGCNPWGTSMVYGLPSGGDTPVDPHSAFTHLKNYPIDGGLVDGPVYGSIYKNLIGIQLKDADEYAAFQSNLAVYHDDYGDYSTNEPTMDGTASLVYLLAAREAESESTARVKKNFSLDHGAIVRGDSTRKEIALVFTGHQYAEGGSFILQTLQQERIKGSFFFTGQFYRTDSFQQLIRQIRKAGHYLGAHSDQHLLYCDWSDRDRLLLTVGEFSFDLGDNYTAMAQQGVAVKNARFFLPPYEWYNDSIAVWTRSLGLQLVNYTPGTLSHADYTTDPDKNYRAAQLIMESILDYEQSRPAGLNGFILLMHTGAGPNRTDKFYYRLPVLIKYLKARGYRFVRIDELLSR